MAKGCCRLRGQCPRGLDRRFVRNQQDENVFMAGWEGSGLELFWEEGRYLRLCCDCRIQLLWANF